MNARSVTAVFGLLAALSAPAGAHVVLDRTEVPAGTYARIALRVGHGCGGAATTALRVTLPPELASARPMPHPGWTIVIGPGGAPGGNTAPSGHSAHAGHGAHAGHNTVGGQAAAGSHAGHEAAPGPKEIAWTGGRLDDAHFDEFALLIRTPAEPSAVLALPVVQECEGGKVARWTERPSAPGERAKEPAPLLRVVVAR
ncbi:YcnI family protein [Roseomonas sp. GCM10028921]